MSEVKTKWNYVKKELKEKSIKELNQLLVELESDKMIMEVALKKGGGSYPKTHGEWKRGNVGEIKKRIACVKTFINQRAKKDYVK